MSFLAVLLLALSMSADAFAAALSKGARLDRPGWGEALRTGAIFGGIEAVTPLIGWAMGMAASRYVVAFDHWIAFGLLTVIGGKMLADISGEEVEAYMLQNSLVGDASKSTSVPLNAPCSDEEHACMVQVR